MKKLQLIVMFGVLMTGVQVHGMQECVRNMIASVVPLSEEQRAPLREEQRQQAALRADYIQVLNEAVQYGNFKKDHPHDNSDHVFRITPSQARLLVKDLSDAGIVVPMKGYVDIVKSNVR